MTAFFIVAAGLIGLAIVLHYGADTVPEPPRPQTPGMPNLGEATGDKLEAKVQEISNATAFAEGYMDRSGNVIGSNVPARFNNPGDLGPGDAPGYASTYEGGSQVVHFPDAETGWRFLNAKWRRILSGQSSAYSLDDTFTAVAKKYAGDWYNWVKNVTSYLGTRPDVTLREWVNT